MKNLKRISCSLLALMLAGSTVAMSACGGKDKTVVDGKTVNVKVYKRGYGADWIYELERQFEKTYAAEGYKVNVLTPSPDLMGEVVLTEMALGVETSGVDLYITQLNPNSVGELGEYGVLAEDIRETVFNKKPIGYDGQEESKTVGEKLIRGAEQWMSDGLGVMYAFNWAASGSGMVVNTRKLAQYNLELPVTTNQMFDCFEKIYMGYNGIENSVKSGTYPVTYPGAGTYLKNGFEAWHRQYDIEEWENSFWSMSEEQGGEMVNRLDDGYEVFNSPAIQSGLEQLYRYMDRRIATYGVNTQTLDQAQAGIMQNKANSSAVFMLNGDWFLNEVKLNNPNTLNDITFIRTPINSALGVRLFGAGTSYNLSNEQADELLALIATLSTENKEVAEIVSTVKTQMNITLNEDDALEVALAYNGYTSYGVEHRAYITKNAPSKEIAELLLRMMASDDFAKTFSEYANVNSPYASTVNTTSQYQFVRAASEVTLNKYAMGYYGVPATGLRKELRNLVPALQQILPKSGVDLASDVRQDAVTMFDDAGNKLSGATTAVYATAAANLMKANYDYAKDNWAEWISRLS